MNISLWDIGNVEEIIEVDVFEIVLNVFKGVSELVGHWSFKGTLGRIDHVLESWGSENLISLLFDEIRLMVELLELKLYILGFLLDLGEGSVVKVCPWEWALTSGKVMIDGIGNINEFLFCFLTELGESLLLGLEVLSNWGCFEVLGRLLELLELLRLDPLVEVGTEETLLVLQVLGSLWLDGDGDEVFGGDDSGESNDGESLEHTIKLII